jgi:hypothetical protein
MKNNTVIEFILSTCLSIGMLLSSAAASESALSDDKRALTAPNGVAPLAGVAILLPQDAADVGNHAWSLRLSVPKVVWEIIGKERPKMEWTKIKADVEMLILEFRMGYSGATQLAEQSQNRLVDLNGKRLGRKEALERLGENTPVLVSVSGEMPDPFYLRCVKPDTLIVLLGLPSSREYNLLPTSRGDNKQAEQDGGGQPATRPESK